MPYDKTIAISLSPNTTPADAQKAWEILHLTSLWRDAAILPKIAQKISQRFDNRFVALTSSGRQALYDILKAANIGKGDEVIIQAFTCIAVPEPIIWTGAKPIYADIKEGTYNIDPESVRQNITKNTKAIIIQHTFGIPGPIEEVKQIAKDHNILLIEDLAHGLGGKYNGQSLGTFGDVAFLSFGRDKTISSIFGGAVISQNRGLIEKIQQAADSRPYPPSKWVFQQLIHPVLFTFIVPNYFRFSIGKITLVLAQKIGLLSKAVATKERTGKKPEHFFYKYSPALAHLLSLQLDQLDTFTKHRQKTVEKYIAQIKGADMTIPANSNPAWLRFPLQVGSPKDILLAARDEHMLLGDWYDASLVPSNCNLESFHYTPGMCPVAEKTGKQVINLPTHPRLTDDDVIRVINFMKQYGN